MRNIIYILFFISLSVSGQTRDSVGTVAYQRDTLICTKTTYTAYKDSIFKVPVVARPERWLYVDSGEVIYRSRSLTTTLAKWCKDNNFQGVINYGFRREVGPFASTSNYANIRQYNRILDSSGVKLRMYQQSEYTVVNFGKFQAATPNANEKCTGLNLENEWWNGASTFTVWDSYNDSLYAYARRNNIPYGPYLGWLKNGGTLTSIQMAGRIQNEGQILILHDYRDNEVSYSYMSSRLEAFASAWKTSGQKTKIPLSVLFSAEQKAWAGADSNKYNNFQGNLIRRLGLTAFEDEFLRQWNLYASPAVKEAFEVRSFTYFMRRFMFIAIPPKP